MLRAPRVPGQLGQPHVHSRVARIVVSLVKEVAFLGFRGAFIKDLDPNARVQEGQFAQAFFQRFKAVVEV